MQFQARHLFHKDGHTGHLVVMVRFESFSDEAIVCTLTSFNNQPLTQRYEIGNPLKMQYAAIGNTAAVNDYPVFKTSNDSLFAPFQYVKIGYAITVKVKDLNWPFLQKKRWKHEQCPHFTQDSFRRFVEYYVRLNMPTIDNYSVIFPKNKEDEADADDRGKLKHTSHYDMWIEGILDQMPEQIHLNIETFERDSNELDRRMRQRQTLNWVCAQ